MRKFFSFLAVVLVISMMMTSAFAAVSSIANSETVDNIKVEESEDIKIVTLAPSNDAETTPEQEAQKAEINSVLEELKAATTTKSDETGSSEQAAEETVDWNAFFEAKDEESEEVVAAKAETLEAVNTLAKEIAAAQAGVSVEELKDDQVVELVPSDMCFIETGADDKPAEIKLDDKIVGVLYKGADGKWQLLKPDEKTGKITLPGNGLVVLLKAKGADGASPDTNEAMPVAAMAMTVVFLAGAAFCLTRKQHA